MIGTIVSLATGETLQSFKAGKDTVIQYQMRDLQKQIITDLSTKDLPGNQKVGAEGEDVWCNYLERQGFWTFHKASVSANGPDVYATRAKNGRLMVIIGEVKASESAVPGLATLKWSILNGYRQMSYRWLDEYASEIADTLLKVGLQEGGITADNLGGMLKRGEIDLYLLGALKESKNRWSIRGFRLFHLGGSETWGDDNGLPEIVNERRVDSKGKPVR